MGRGKSALVPISTYLLHSSGPIALDEGMDRPLPMPTFASFLAITLAQPTPAPINTIFGEVSGCCWITLWTSPPATLAEEVLTLGVDLGKADRVVSTADKETVIVGIVPPTTTQDEREGGSTTKGHSSLSMSSKAGKSTRLRLIEVGKSIPGDHKRKGELLEIDGRKGCPIIGSKLYPMVDPTIE